MAWWWKQKIHSSWLIAVFCGCFVAGVWLASLFPVGWYWGIGAGAGVIVCFTYRTYWSVLILVCVSLVSGLGYGSAHIVSRSVYDEYIGSAVVVTGKIKEDPSRSSSGSLSLQLDSIRIGNEPLPGSVLVSVRSTKEVKRGDFITIHGTMKAAFGSFPATVTAKEIVRVVRPIPGDIGRVVRDWFADEVRTVIPDPQASLGIGFLTGQKSALPSDLSDALKIAGLTHIVVASGYNLTILVQMSRKLFLKVSKFLSAVSSGLMIILFVAVTGMSPSMTRAGLVSGMSLMAWYYGRAFHPFVLLPLAAAITVFIQPSYVWGDLGWQLSFVAFIGVMVVAPLLQAYFYGSKEPNALRQILGETISAHAVTLPVIALSFGTVSHVAIIANVLVVPFVPLAMLLTFTSGLWAIAGLPFGDVIAMPAIWLLGYMISVARFVSELSWAQSDISWPAWVWDVYTCLFAGVCIWMWRATRYNFRSGEPLL